MVWPPIIMWMSGRAWIQSRSLNLNSEGESVSAAICMLNRDGWEQGLGSLNLSLLPAESYQTTVCLPPANNNGFIQREKDSQSNTRLLAGLTPAESIPLSGKGREKWQQFLEPLSLNVFFSFWFASVLPCGLIDLGANLHGLLRLGCEKSA